MTGARPLLTFLVALLAVAGPVAPASAHSQMTWAVHISLAPRWFVGDA
jgi:hypothetical protein